LFSHLQIPDPRERWLVGLADAVLGVGAAVRRLVPGRRPLTPPSRILLLRLERIGDLLMTRAAIHAVRESAPSARIDLVVGSWNAPIANLIRDVDLVETLDVPWLAREARGHGFDHLIRVASSWRSRRYDLAINFEGDIRSNALLAVAGVPRRTGFGMAGGGPLLTAVLTHDPRVHTAVNTLRLVERAFDLQDGSLEGRVDPWSEQAAPALNVPEEIRLQADGLLGVRLAGRGRESADVPFIALHPGGDRAIKLWAPERFVEVARLLAARCPATIVLTGGPGDKAVAGLVESALSPGVRVINLAGRVDLLPLAAVLERVSVFVTGDTGPMHLAAAVGTPTVGIFGPSDPVRWGPLSHAALAVRIDLPCSPCNRIRRPPSRCVGHVPDCLAGVDVERVYQAAVTLLERQRAQAPPPADGAAEAHR
jgi:heptosyltransferase-2